jgi:hypothetical protein
MCGTTPSSLHHLCCFCRGTYICVAQPLLPSTICAAFVEVRIVDAHCKDTIPKILYKYSQKKELHGYSPNSYIHVSVSDLYNPLIGQPIYSAAGK